MPWLGDVINQIRGEIERHDNPSEQLKEVLLWRGFLASSNEGQTYLLRGSNRGDEDDCKTLEELGLDLDRLQDEHFTARVGWGAFTGRQHDAIQKILAIPSPDGMTDVGFRCNEWRDFRRLKFGYALPTKECDIGIALLVRTLPFLSVPTRLSGHGDNDTCHLHIDFDGPYAYHWFRAVFRHKLEGDLGALAGLFNFQPTPDDGALALHIGTETEDAQVAFSFFSAGQQLARLMMNEDFGAEIRQIKHDACDHFHGNRIAPTVNAWQAYLAQNNLW